MIGLALSALFLVMRGRSWKALTNRPCRIHAEIPVTGSLRPASLQASGLLDLSSVVVYKTAALPVRAVHTPSTLEFRRGQAEGRDLATDPGHSFAARDRLANARRPSAVSRTTTGQPTCDSGL
jgi:hypothetical protein